MHALVSVKIVSEASLRAALTRHRESYYRLGVQRVDRQALGHTVVYLAQQFSSFPAILGGLVGGRAALACSRRTVAGDCRFLLVLTVCCTVTAALCFVFTTTKLLAVSSTIGRMNSSTLPLIVIHTVASFCISAEYLSYSKWYPFALCLSRGLRVYLSNACQLSAL